jgi:hypothetical protein
MRLSTPPIRATFWRMLPTSSSAYITSFVIYAMASMLSSPIHTNPSTYEPPSPAQSALTRLTKNIPATPQWIWRRTTLTCPIHPHNPTHPTRSLFMLVTHKRRQQRPP